MAENPAMTVAITAHPTEERLRAFSLGRLPENERDAIERHLGACDKCIELLGSADQENRDTLLELAREAAATPAPRAPLAAAPPAIPPELADHPRYKILSPLGEGGMGVVYKAEHKLMERMVALKVINRRLTANDQAVERFRREVRAAAKLSHPNIVTAHDAEEANGLHFLVMEFVEGISLDRYVAKQKGPIPIGLACHFIRQAALGLQHAHQQGMVHRDIKPQNLILTRKGHLKILDFGLARLGEENQPDGISTPNLVVGTPDYLAPEQARDSHTVDIRADIYALGCTLYFLLAKRVPFPGGSAFEKMVAHTEKQPEPLVKLRPDLPPEVEEIVVRMMAKNAQDRYQTPAEVATALAPFARLTSASATDLVPALRAEPSPFADLPAMTPEPATTQAMRPRRAAPSPRASIGPIVGIGVAALLISSVFAYFALRDDKTPAEKTPDEVAKNKEPGPGPKQPPFNKQPPPKIDRKDNIGPPPKGDPRFFPKDVAWENAKYRVLIAVPRWGLWFNDFEPVRRTLVERGVYVAVAGSDFGQVTLLPKPGNMAPPDWHLDAKQAFVTDLDVRGFDAIIFCGANVDMFNPKKTAMKDWASEMKLDPALTLGKKMREMRDDGKIVAGICTGQAVLIWHDVLKDGMKAARVTTDLFYDLENSYPKVRWQRDQGVVRDGNLITASGPGEAVRFADEIHRTLLERKK